MHGAIHLSLMIGPAVPLPVPKAVLDALQSVQVRVATDRPSGFELKFALDNRSPLATLFLVSGGASPIPIVRVVIIVTVNGTPHVLMDGVMTEHSAEPTAGGSQSTLTVRGEDLTRVMDYIDGTGFPFAAMPVEARVLTIVSKYAALGIVPLVVPRILFDVPVPTKEIPVQNGKDLAYIKQLAELSGYTFYLDPGPVPGTSKAYFGPLIKVGLPQPALNVNMDAHTNVESLTFKLEGDKAVQPVIEILIPSTKLKISIPVPNLSPFNPPLGIIPPKAKEKVRFPAAKLSAIKAALLAAGKASRGQDAVVATGTLNVLRYGRPLRARGLVGVRGATRPFDGLYYVEEVTHDIKRGEYKQQFVLRRNGLLSTVPRVRP